MAEFARCIEAAFNNGKITRELADLLANAEDVQNTIDNVLVDLSRQKREAAIQAVRMADAWRDITSHEISAYDGLVSLLTKDPTGKAGYKNVEYLAAYYSKRYSSKWAEALSRFRTRTLGYSQDIEGINKLVRAIYGEAVDDPQIVEFARQWKELTDEMRTEFNRQGGSISANEKWNLPQSHDADAVRKVGRDEWKRVVRPMMDRGSMLDDVGNPLTDDEFERLLDYTYDSITTNGLNKLKDFTSVNMGRKLSRKGSERRFLYFKDAQSWLDYQDRFGRGDIFAVLTDHIETSSHDIALMERMGTNPNTMFDALLMQVEKDKGITNRQRYFARNIFNVVSGKLNQGDLVGVSDFMQTTRNVLTASTLGNAFLSAISDVGFQTITARYNDVPAFKVLSRQLSLMNPANEADRIFAAKIGFIADAWTHRASAANRYVDVYGTGASAKMAEGVMRASLLQPWTDAGRKAFGMEYSSMLAENFGKTLGELDDATKRAFKTYGITEADWDAFRASTPLEFDGARFADVTQPNGVKFSQMILSETDYAVPTPDARVRAITTGGLERATIEGQAWRAAMMLKSFPLTIATTHFYRAAYQATTAGKLAYTGSLLAMTTALGAIALQAKDIAAGREPRPMDNPKFFAAAFQQGGGLGIMGDFLFSDVNRFGGGITQTLLGPTGELIDTSVKFTLGNVREAIQGEETNVLGEGVRILERYSPSVWQVQLLKNSLFDQVELLADPSAQKRYNRMMRKRQKEFKQGYWWKPGEPLPEGMK